MNLFFLKHPRLALALSILFVGLLALVPAYADGADASPNVDNTTVSTQTYTLHGDGSWTDEAGQLVNVAAETEAAVTPIDNHRFYFGPSYNPERLLCIKDYTPESAVSWDINRVAVEWSKANEFHVWWDDMLGGGNNCATYDALQTMNIYSYSEDGSGSCGTVAIGKNASGFITSATGWLNRTADNTLCRQTFTLRQNIISAIVGRLLGLKFHTAFADSVMNNYLTYKLQIPYPRPADFAGISARY